MSDSSGLRRMFIAAMGEGIESFSTPWYRQIERAFNARAVPSAPLPATARQRLIGKVLSRLGLLRGLPGQRGDLYIVPIMDTAEFRFYPICFRNQIVPICFDCWPHRWPRFDRIFRRHNIPHAFVTARAVRDEFARRHPGIRFTWLPEATDPRSWDPSKPLASRRIDVSTLR